MAQAFDRLRRDGEGFYFYEGRTDDMIKVAGAWVSPAEVEAVLASHPAVTDCAVTGYTAFDGLTRIAAHIVLRTVPLQSVDDPQAELAALLLAHAARRLPPFKIPAKILFPTSLPKTPSGKTRRFLLRQQNPGAPTTAPQAGIPGGPGIST